MLKHTFIHIRRVGDKTEQTLWDNNIITWEDAIANELPLGPKTSTKITKHAKQSKEALKAGDHTAFQDLPNKETWRAYPELKENTAFIDIETTGLDKYTNTVTTVAVTDHETTRVFIKDQDLYELPTYLKQYNHLVTFNGRQFDIPFLEHNFSTLEIDHIHTDLRFTLKDLGHTGGLKQIEAELGVSRDLDGVDGREAVKLWHQYDMHDDEDALDRLVHYNKEDTKNLKDLLRYAYRKKRDNKPV
jgi:uncharacterized protein YprB with RNaseH-like and TPR domain